MRKIAVGTVDMNMRKTAIGFSEKLFDQIKKRAEQNDRSFSAEVRALCEKGIAQLRREELQVKFLEKALSAKNER